MMKAPLFIVPLILFLSACVDGETTATVDGTETVTAGAKSETHQEYDVLESYELRSDPSADSPRIVNQKASDMLGETHYMSIDPSVTVRVLSTEGDWAEIQVTQPEHLRDSHQGWVPKSVINYGSSTDKLDGWIRYTSQVYDAPSTSGTPVGYLSPPAAVGVADDGSGWLRLIHGPIKSEANNEFLEAPDFDDGLYIEKSNFTTELPSQWN